MVKGKRQLQNEGGYQYGNHLKALSNMMEEETHIVDNMSEHEGIGQVFYLMKLKTNQKYLGELKEAISGLSQSNQWRLGKSEGEPRTPLPATNSDRQSPEGRSRESITKFS